MLKYLKNKYKTVTNTHEKKDNIVIGIGTIGHVELGQNVTIDLTPTMILAEAESTDGKSPFLVQEYLESGVIKKISKEVLDETTYSLRCYFDNECDDFLQINVIDNNLDSAIMFRRYERMFHNGEVGEDEGFTDSDGEFLPLDFCLNEMIGNNFFQIAIDNESIEYERVYSHKEEETQILKSSKGTLSNNLLECLYQRGIESDEVNRELLLLSHLDGEEENTFSIYVGLDVSLATLEIK